MKMKSQNLIKITSILVFSIIVVACSGNSYDSNMDESTEEEYIEPSNDNQNICTIHNIQLDTYEDGSTYCIKCLSDSQQEAEARDAEANAIEEAEIESQQRKGNNCVWCSDTYYGRSYSKSSKDQNCEPYSGYGDYCSRKCATEACWNDKY